MSTLFPDLREKLIASAEALAEPPVKNRRHKRWKMASPLLVAGSLLAGGSVATAAAMTLWSGSDFDRPAVASLDPELAAQFAVLRQAPTGVPEPVAKALGAGGGVMGKNLALARQLTTPAGPAWVFPAGDGQLCMAAARQDTDINNGTISMGCATPPALIALGYEDENGDRTQTALIPDGHTAIVTSADRPARPVPAPAGVASVRLGPSEALQTMSN